MTAAEAWYHGYRQDAGGAVVAVEAPDGQLLGLLPHIVKHSPDGFQWGYGGSGPAELARCLLLAALGVDGKPGRCLTCDGTQRVVWDLDSRMERVADPTDAPDEIVRCGDCDDGHRRVPYQDFKFEQVARWQDEWRISRSEAAAVVAPARNRAVDGGSGTCAQTTRAAASRRCGGWYAVPVTSLSPPTANRRPAGPATSTGARPTCGCTRCTRCRRR